MAEPTPRQGPATFSMEDAGVVQPLADQLLSAPTANAPQIAPGIGTQAPGVNDSDARTFRAISDLASGMLAPKIKEAAQEQFMQGVQQAATGESLGEIVKDKPWYTDIFAPSSALAGARTYTAQRAVAEWAGKMQEQMPQLAKVGPDQLQSAATGAMQGFLTGDAGADSMITSAVVEHMAPLFKQHAKEHYIYVQKQASEAQIGSWEADAKVYQGFAQKAATGDGTVSQDDLNSAKDRILSGIMPFADQSDEAFERNIASFLEGAGTSGNFQVVKLFKESGLYDKIKPDLRAQLDRSLHVSGVQTLAKAVPHFALDMAMLTKDPTQDPRLIADKVAALNAKAAAYTGVSEAELIPSSTVDNIVGSVLVAQQKAAAAAAKTANTAAAKLAAETLGVQQAMGQITQGGGAIDRFIHLGEGNEVSAEKAGTLLYGQAKTPQERATVLNSRLEKPFSVIKSIYDNKLRSEEFQQGVGSMAAEYQAMDERVKPLYFKDTDRAVLDRFNTLVKTDMPPADAWVVARHSVGPDLIPDDKHDSVTKAIRTQVESAHENWLHSNTVDDASLRTIGAMTARAYKADRTNTSQDVAVQRALTSASANGLDIQGKHAMLKVRPSDAPLHMVVGESEEGTAHAFEDLMVERAAAHGSKLDDYEIFRLPDTGSGPYTQRQARMRVVTYDAAGKSVSWDITSADIKGRVTSNASKQVRNRAIPQDGRSRSGTVTDFDPNDPTQGQTGPGAIPQ